MNEQVMCKLWELERVWRRGLGGKLWVNSQLLQKADFPIWVHTLVPQHTSWDKPLHLLLKDVVRKKLNHRCACSWVSGAERVPNSNQFSSLPSSPT